MKKCIALLLTGVMLLGLLSGCNTYQNDDSASSAGSTTLLTCCTRAAA